MSGLSPTELILAWAEGAVHVTPADENVWALVGKLDPASSWRVAREGYLAMLGDLGGERSGLVMKLIVPLRPTEDLAIHPPSEVRLTEEMDPNYPAMFAVHDLMRRRDWEPFEIYSRPVPSESFFPNHVDDIQASYVVFRCEEEVDESAPYRRQLVFEHVCP